jgi:hypothetical protein
VHRHHCIIQGIQRGVLQIQDSVRQNITLDP